MKRQYHLFDANGKVLGRLAVEIANFLSGKGKVDYTPHIDGGDFVVVVNANKVVLTGNKESDKIYHRFSGYPGGITDVNVKQQREKDASKIIHQAVFGMMRKNRLSAEMLKRLFVFNNSEHNFNIDFQH